jgi:hypothetical protein
MATFICRARKMVLSSFSRFSLTFRIVASWVPAGFTDSVVATAD